jgi:hypothetical protein
VNRYKVKDPIYLKKLSNSQIGTPRKKHSEKTKELCREIMLKEWSINREIRLQIHRSDTTREKISKSISLIGYKKNITYIHGIRCESKLEESFVNYCVDNNISIKRFRHKNKKSIKVGINWRVPDFIINKNMVIDVKDWHHWFRKELDDGLVKYKEIEKWCIPNGYSFYFWIDNQFKQIWQVIEQKTKN